jgi:hypothetical protein
MVHQDSLDHLVTDIAVTGRCVLVLGKGNSARETDDNLVKNAAVIHLTGLGTHERGTARRP